MYPASFSYYAPRSVEETLQLLNQLGDDAKLLAGGHSLLPAMKLRLAEPQILIDIGQLPGLSGVRVEGGELVIGALTVHADVAASDAVKQHVPALADAASRIGDVQVRNRGTIGGSVAHADPGADFPVILTALGGSFGLQAPSGTRSVAADDFFVDIFTTSLEANELLTEIRVPIPPSGAGTGYAKLGHPASGYVVVSVGVLLERDANGGCSNARVAVGGLAGSPVRAVGVEDALRGQQLTPEIIAAAAAHAAEGTDPDDDTYASADYKRHIATVYARRAFEAAVARMGS